MLPHERSLLKELGNDFAIVGVNSDPKERLKQLVTDGTTTWRNFTDQQKDGRISKQWGVTGWPTLYILDQKGVIRHIGLRGDSMEKAIKDLIAEGKANGSAVSTPVVNSKPKSVEVSAKSSAALKAAATSLENAAASLEAAAASLEQ